MFKLPTAAAVILLALAAPATSLAAEKDKGKDKQRAEDVMDHRKMAEAHTRAAQCLEAGKPEKDCHEQLAKDCKGIGIGKTCGMRHRHKH